MKNIGIYIYDEAEVLDFAGPFEVLSVASRFLDEKEKFNVFFVSEKNTVIKARGGFCVQAHYTFENCPSIDLLIVVGGVHTAEVKNTNVTSWVAKVAKKAKLVTSVCTGAFILAQAKVLTSQKVTTHWDDIEDLEKDFPSFDVQKNVRWVDEGDIITSAGISAGIDMSLHIVSKIRSNDLAKQTAKQMDFDWKKNT